MKTIIVSLHGASLSAFGCYGNEWIATPNLDGFAAEGIVFDRQIIETPEVETIRRALLPADVHQSTHTVLIRANRPENDLASWFYDNWGEMFDARPDEAGKPTLLDVLQELLPTLRKHESWLLWIDCDILLPPWDIPQDLFNVYIDEEDEEETLDRADEYEEEQEIESLADIDIDNYETVMPIAPWYDPPYGAFDNSDPAIWEYLHRSYAALMTLFDAEMGELFALLREYELDTSATWIITADRGFPLGEHGIVGPVPMPLHQELVHVPLLMRLPNAMEAGRRVSGLTVPTNVHQLPSSWNENIKEVVISHWEDSKSIRTTEWTYIPIEAEVKLFAWPEDRWERNDVASMHEDVIAELSQR